MKLDGDTCSIKNRAQQKLGKSGIAKRSAGILRHITSIIARNLSMVEGLLQSVKNTSTLEMEGKFKDVFQFLGYSWTKFYALLFLTHHLNQLTLAKLNFQAPKLSTSLFLLPYLFKSHVKRRMAKRAFLEISLLENCNRVLI